MWFQKWNLNLVIVNGHYISGQNHETILNLDSIHIFTWAVMCKLDIHPWNHTSQEQHNRVSFPKTRSRECSWNSENAHSVLECIRPFLLGQLYGLFWENQRKENPRSLTLISTLLNHYVQLEFLAVHFGRTI